METMMQKTIVHISLVVVLLLLSASAVLAQSGLSLSAEFVYTDSGQTVVDKEGETLHLTTRGLEAAGTIDCNGNAACLEQGLDGTSLKLRHNVTLSFIPGSGLSRMDFRGRLSPAGATQSFSLSGTDEAAQVDCPGGASQPCAVTAQIVGTVAQDGQIVGSFTYELTGRITIVDGILGFLPSSGTTWLDFHTDISLGG
jgi:hypothetical protein